MTAARARDRSAYDLIISGGTVVDGSGAAAYVADIGITGDRISAIGALNGATAARRISAVGAVVTPGLIDLHGHSDHSLLMENSALSKLSQGVTTDVIGNCGMSAAPYRKGNSLLGFTTEAAVAARGGARWSTMESYLQVLADARPGCNVAPQMGYGTGLHLGLAESGSLEDANRIALRHVEEALDAGAVGISLGLYYPPERDISPTDVENVARAVARHGALLSVHLRDEGGFSVGLDAAVQEAITACLPGGTRLEISHLKAMGPGGWSRIDRALEKILSARVAGLDVGADQYPYDAGELALADAVGAIRATVTATGRIDEDMVRHRIEQRGGAERISLAHCLTRHELVGLNLVEAAESLGLPVVAGVRLLIDEDNATVASHGMRESDIERIMRYPWVCVGSDGVSIPLDLFPVLDNPHPRNFGCFTRFLGRYVRDREVVSMEMGVHKATSVGMQRVQLPERGVLREGYFADIAVFDWAGIDDRADYANPSLVSTGVVHVLVNGRVALEDGVLTAERAGRVLRRQG